MIKAWPLYLAWELVIFCYGLRNLSQMLDMNRDTIVVLVMWADIVARLCILQILVPADASSRTERHLWWPNNWCLLKFSQWWGKKYIKPAFSIDQGTCWSLWHHCDSCCELLLLMGNTSECCRGGTRWAWFKTQGAAHWSRAASRWVSSLSYLLGGYREQPTTVVAIHFICFTYFSEAWSAHLLRGNNWCSLSYYWDFGLT